MSYSFIHDKDFQTLQPWTDCIGPLHELNVQDSLLIARIGHVAILLPLDLYEKLRGLVGRKIAILRTDEGYRYREVVKSAT